MSGTRALDCLVRTESEQKVVLTVTSSSTCRSSYQNTPLGDITDNQSDFNFSSVRIGFTLPDSKQTTSFTSVALLRAD